MAPRLAAGLTVSALIRRIEAAGGHATVIAKGDPTAGALLVQLADRGVAGALMERTLGTTGYGWGETAPTGDSDDYIARRRRGDPDLWVVEIDHPDARAILIDVTGG